MVSALRGQNGDACCLRVVSQLAGFVVRVVSFILPFMVGPRTWRLISLGVTIRVFIFNGAVIVTGIGVSPN